MRSFRRFMLFLILLAVLGGVGLHWLARSSLGVSCLEGRIRSVTGLETSIGRVRLGVGFGLTISDLRLSLGGGEDGGLTVLMVPTVLVQRVGGRRFVRLIRPEITVIRSALGNWIPSQMKDFVGDGLWWESLAALAARVQSGFEVSDAVIMLKDEDGRGIKSYSGLDWCHQPLRLIRRPGLMHDVVTLQCIDGNRIEFSGEWISDGRQVSFIGAVPTEVPLYADDETEETAVLVPVAESEVKLNPEGEGE